jgi:hypothetical protein
MDYRNSIGGNCESQQRREAQRVNLEEWTERVLQMMKGDEQWCKSEGERVTWVPRKIRIETSAKDGVPKMG